MDKLQKRIRDTEATLVEERMHERSAEEVQRKRDVALMLIGGFKTANNIARSINTELMRALIRFQEEKCYALFGYARFADFLDEWEHSPMTKSQFYERKALLEKEGDLFDVYGEIGLSIRTRKQLGQGSVELDGENLVIQPDEDGQDPIVIPKSDQALVIEVLTRISDDKVRMKDTNRRLQEKQAKHDEKIRGLCDELHRAKAERLTELGRDAHTLARLDAVLAINRLAEAASELSAIEKEQFRDFICEDIQHAFNRLRFAYRTDGTEKPVAVENGLAGPILHGETFDELLENFINEHVDLTLNGGGGDNEAELAARM